MLGEGAAEAAEAFGQSEESESHWNHYLIDHPPSLVLSPSYCCYPDGRSAEYEPRISVVLKDAALMRK